MEPWEHRAPPVLYKYFHPDRFHILTSAKVRFSQRTAFDDDHELQPKFESFGTADQVRLYLAANPIPIDPRLGPDAFIALLARTPSLQDHVTDIAAAAMRSPDAYGVFCLTDTPDNDRMWQEYADNERGFVIGFDTAHPGFSLLTSPGRLGKVDYSDKRFGAFLDTYFSHGAGVFYRKRMRYAFEWEWRSIRALDRLEHCPGDIYLSRFDPNCVKEIIIRRGCSIELKLRHFLAVDSRYRHVKLQCQRHSLVTT
jgi:hypothetical protein